MTSTLPDARTAPLKPEELTVVALMDAVARVTSNADVHRTTLLACMAALREQPSWHAMVLPNREELSSALLLLRSHHLAQLDDEGFSLTNAGREATEAVSVEIRGELEGLMRRKLQEWQLVG